MTAREFLSAIPKRPPQGAYLFLGPDFHSRREARQAIVAAALGEEDRESGMTQLDLSETTIASVLDEASAMSLFASRRLIWVSNAEAALPKRLTAKDDDDGVGATLAAYVRNPTPGTTVVFEASRFGFDGEDKAKSDRVRKFYAALPVVEFPPISPAEAMRLAKETAASLQLKLTPAQIDRVVTALDADAGRIIVELEKLSLFAGQRAVRDEDLTGLVPNASSATIFELVNALARRDRARALGVLDTLVREGEYLPLVLTFLATLFRLALAASEARLAGGPQLQSHFQKLGIAMWPARAAQVADTMRAFPPAQLRRAITLTFETDRAMRNTRPDDRIVMENFVWKLTA